MGSVANLLEPNPLDLYCNSITQAGAMKAKGSAIAGATVLTTAQSGSYFTLSQVGAYAVTLPTPSTANIGLQYCFTVVGAAANSVTLSTGGADLIGTIVNDVTSVLPCTGTTLTVVASTAALGDSIELHYVSATQVFARCVSSTNGGITIT